MNQWNDFRVTFHVSGLRIVSAPSWVATLFFTNRVRLSWALITSPVTTRLKELFCGVFSRVVSGDVITNKTLFATVLLSFRVVGGRFWTFQNWLCGVGWCDQAIRMTTSRKSTDKWVKLMQVLHPSISVVWVKAIDRQGINLPIIVCRPEALKNLSKADEVWTYRSSNDLSSNCFEKFSDSKALFSFRRYLKKFKNMYILLGFQLNKILIYNIIIVLCSLLYLN